MPPLVNSQLPNWIPLVISCLALLVAAAPAQLYLQLLKIGKTTINSTSVQIYFRADLNANNPIRYLKLAIQFLNESGHTRVIKNIKMRFYNGEEYFNLYVIEKILPPSEIIEAYKVRELVYDLEFDTRIVALPLVPIAERSAFVEISYSLKKENLVHFVHDITIHEADN